MPCELCLEALSNGQNFCSHCGDRTQSVTVESLQLQIVSLNGQIAKLIEAREGAEQRFLEIDTTEKIVTRVMTWAKVFGFFVGIPLLITLTVLGILAGKSYENFSDIVRGATSSVNVVLDRARADARSAEQQASSALATSKTVNQDIKGTQEHLTSLSASVKRSSIRVGQLDSNLADQKSKVDALNAATTAQNKAIRLLSRNVQELDKSRIEQDINSTHPEFGSHSVKSASGEILSTRTKPANAIYVAIDVFSRDSVKPNFKSSQIAIGLTALQEHGFHTFFGQVALFASAGSTSVPLAAFNSSTCQKAGLKSDPANQSVPCIVYFRESTRAKAIEARQLLDSTEHIPDDKVRLVPVTSLNEGLRELVEKSGLDMAIVLGP